MILGEIEVNQFAQIRLIVETKFEDDSERQLEGHFNVSSKQMLNYKTKN